MPSHEIELLDRYPGDASASVVWWCRDCGKRVAYRVPNHRKAHAYGRCADCVAVEVNAAIRRQAARQRATPPRGCS